MQVILNLLLSRVTVLIERTEIQEKRLKAQNRLSLKWQAIKKRRNTDWKKAAKKDVFEAILFCVKCASWNAFLHLHKLLAASKRLVNKNLTELWEERENWLIEWTTSIRESSIELIEWNFKWRSQCEKSEWHICIDRAIQSHFYADSPARKSNNNSFKRAQVKMSETLDFKSGQQNKGVHIKNMSSFSVRKLIDHNELNTKQQCCKMWCWKLSSHCDIHAAIESEKEYENDKIYI